MFTSGRPIRLSGNISNPSDRSALTTFLDIFVNSDDDDDADVPIFEGSVREFSSDQFRRSKSIKFEWQGSCNSFAGLDFSDHSNSSFVNTHEELPERRSTNQSQKTLFDCFTKTSLDATIFSESEDESWNQEIQEVTKALDDFHPSILIPQSTDSKLHPLAHLSNSRAHTVEQIKHERYSKPLPCSTNTSNHSAVEQQRSLKRNEEFPKSISSGCTKHVQSCYLLNKSSRKESSANILECARFINGALSGTNLVTDSSESCSSLSLCSLNDDEFMISLTGVLSMTAESVDHKVPQSIRVGKGQLFDMSNDTAPRVPSRCPSPTPFLRLIKLEKSNSPH